MIEERIAEEIREIFARLEKGEISLQEMEQALTDYAVKLYWQRPLVYE